MFGEDGILVKWSHWHCFLPSSFHIDIFVLTATGIPATHYILTEKAKTKQLSLVLLQNDVWCSSGHACRLVATKKLTETCQHLLLHLG